MSEECQASGPSLVEIKVTKSGCPVMPEGDVIILKGPAIDYEKSGPVCVTAINAVYPWIMLTRYGVKTPDLDYDAENGCYHAVCPCGEVYFDIRKINE
jgi:uncharacterized repeat protein (TIGR04076 family)